MSPESEKRARRVAKKYRAKISPGGEDEGCERAANWKACREDQDVPGVS
jgi:hypothetical protein